MFSEPNLDIKVGQKSGLNRSILRSDWSEFHRMLEYKLQWRRGRLIRVPAPYTSQTCSVCGYCAAENRATQALFRCMKCGFETNADLNGSLNIRRAGIARIAREVNGVSRQQR